MKKIYLIVFIVSITTITQAQIQFGIKGGVNVSGPFNGGNLDKVSRFNTNLTAAQNDSSYPSYLPKIGIQLGIVGVMQLSRNGFHRKNKEKICFLSVEPEVLFSYQNYNVEEVGNVSLLNINVPIMVKLTFGKSWFVELGPYINFLLDQKHTGDHSELLVNNSSISMGGATGFGCLLPSGNIGLDLRTSLGTDIPNNLTARPINTMTQLDVFYLLGKRKRSSAD